MPEPPAFVIRLINMIPHLRAQTVDGTALEVRHGEHRTRFALEHVPRVGTREREWLLNRARSAPSPMIVTGRLSAEAREELARGGLSWVERETGVVHIDAPPLLVHWALPPVDKEPARRPSASLKGIGSTVAELLLAEVRHREFTLAEVASRAGASKQRTGQILSALTDEGWVEATGRTRNRVYRVRDRPALLARWAEQLPTPEIQVHAYRWTRDTDTLFLRLTLLDEMQIQWAIGGVSAAYLYDPVLTQMPMPTVWVEAGQDVGEVIDVLDAEPATDNGSANLTFWLSEQNAALRFATRLTPGWMGGLSVPVVSMPRAYAEACRMGGRALDVADAVREEILS